MFSRQCYRIQRFERISNAYCNLGLRECFALLANCSLGLGRLDEASRLLENIDTKEVAQLAGIPDWFANVALAQSEISYRKAGPRRRPQAAANRRAGVL